MSSLLRFGRKLAIPSTIQIKTDLRMMEAVDTLAADDSARPMSDEDRRHAAGDLALKHGISIERATMLVDRHGMARHALEAAAQALQERKD